MKSIWIALLFLFVGTFFSCKKHLFGVLGDTLTDDFSFTRIRVPGIACSTNDTLQTFDQGFLTFSNEHILCVQIEMDASDFEQMRFESRFGPSILDQDGSTVISTFFEYLPQCDVAWPDHYQWYEADMTIDGLSMDHIGIRKKGFLGSIFSNAPSIKLKTNHFDADQSFGKTKNITLNNNAEDPTRLRMIYNLKIFEKMNYPAPRAHLANVSINGEHLGAYTHLEAIDDDFLMRAYGNSNGHLYEGQLADFILDNVTRWDAKTTYTDVLFNPLRNIARVIESSDDDDLVSALSAYIDLEAFVDFWALEVFLGHEDGYSSNRNNFLVYFDSGIGNRVRFIPWGLNYMNQVDAPNEAFNAYIAAALPRRLSRIEDISSLFESRLQYILDEIWEESEVIGWIDDYSGLVESAQVDENYEAMVAEMKTWVLGRRAQIEQWLEDGLPMAEAGVSKDCLF